MTWRCKLILAVHLGIVVGLMVNHADAAERTTPPPTTGTDYDLIRSGQFVVRKLPSAEACNEALAAQRARHAATKTSGSERWICREDRWTNVSYGPNPQTPPPPACPAAPVGTPIACPSGTSGVWTPIATVGSAPECVVSWQSSPPPGACLAIPPTPSGTATLTWTPPTRNTDGSPLTDLSGYFLRYGTTLGMANVVQIRGMTRWTVENLEPGTYYFTITAYRSGTSGIVESDPSNMVTKVVR